MSRGCSVPFHCFIVLLLVTVVVFNMLLLLILFKTARRTGHAGLFNLNQKEKCNRKRSKKLKF